MRNSSRFIQTRYLSKPWYNEKSHMWFCYHRLFYGSLIYRGRKAFAFNTMLNIKSALKFKAEIDPSLLFFAAMIKVSPSVILFPIRKSGVVQRSPFPISRRKQATFAVKWIIKLLKDGSRVISVASIVNLLIESLNNKGKALETKDDFHTVASSNRHLVNFYR